MHEKIEVATQILHLSECRYNNALLKYYIIINEIPLAELNLHVLSFGLEIEMYFEENDCKNCISSIIKDITTSKEDIFSLAATLKNNLVTPISLKDIVHDYLCKI